MCWHAFCYRNGANGGAAAQTAVWPPKQRLARGPLMRVGGMVALPLAIRHCQIVFGTSEARFLRADGPERPFVGVIRSALSHPNFRISRRALAPGSGGKTVG